MKRSLSTLAVVALSAASVTLLAGPAQASGCGTTNLDQTGFAATFDTSETRATGHNEFAEQYDGVHVYTEGNTSTDKAAAYYGGLGVPLAEQTANSNYGLNITSATGGKPGYNLIIDANGPDVAGGFATLVYEPDIYQGRWWSNSAAVQGVPAGDGYSHSGSLDQYVAGNPDAVIKAFGYSLGSGVKGDVVIQSITFGCNVFAFDYTAAPVANVAPTASFETTINGQDVAFNGAASADTDGTIVSYAWEFGDGETNLTTGPTDGHTYAPGTYTAKLTVTDDDGATGTFESTFTIAAPVPTNTVQDTFLPNTGAETAGWLTVGAAFLMAGIGWTLFGRRNKATATV